jgi:hypothetical protein
MVIDEAELEQWLVAWAAREVPGAVLRVHESEPGTWTASIGGEGHEHGAHHFSMTGPTRIAALEHLKAQCDRHQL